MRKTEIKFLPKSPIQRNNAWVCLALPYADKRAYEDRLNALVPGRWSTPAMSRLVAGNKLVIVICRIKKAACQIMCHAAMRFQQIVSAA